ncbi:hypothetical protein [Nocardia xishanensis]|uniref:hypothetical protein n=1 Tax=Nocardia xishanensis TaxID=238964 RepID=UPI00342CB015
MGVWQSLEVPGYGRLTVRDGVEVRSTDAPGEVFDDAIVFEFESNEALPPDFQVHFLQFAAHELRMHGPNGDFSGHGDPVLSGDSGRLSWRVDTLPPQGTGSDAAVIRPWYDAGGNHSADGATLTMADRPGFRVPTSVDSMLREQLSHPANQAEISRCGTPTSADFIQHFDTYVVGVRPGGTEVVAHVRWQSITALDRIDDGAGHDSSAPPVHSIRAPERVFAVPHDQWTTLRDDPRPLHHYANGLPHGAADDHVTAPSIPAHQGGHGSTPHDAIEGVPVHPHPQTPSQPPQAPPGMDFHEAPAGAPPGMDFGADHHDALKHPVTELPHDFPMPDQGHPSLWKFDKADHPGHHGTAPQAAPTPVPHSTPAPHPVPHDAPDAGSSPPAQSGHTAVYPADATAPVTAADFQAHSSHRQAVADAGVTSTLGHDAGAGQTTGHGSNQSPFPGGEHTGSQPVDTQGNPVKTFNFKETLRETDGADHRDQSTPHGASSPDHNAGAYPNPIAGQDQPLGMDFGSPLATAAGPHHPGVVASAEHHEGGTSGWADAGGPPELGPMPGM